VEHHNRRTVIPVLMQIDVGAPLIWQHQIGEVFPNQRADQVEVDLG